MDGFKNLENMTKKKEKRNKENIETPICKKDKVINIGSINGGKDRIIQLEKGKSLPSELDNKYYASLKNEGII